MQMGVDCTRQQVLRLIEGAGEDAVIVLQSDHGPGYGSLLGDGGATLEDTPTKDMWVRASAFSAVRLPSRCRSQVSDTYGGCQYISNSFQLSFRNTQGVGAGIVVLGLV